MPKKLDTNLIIRIPIEMKKELKKLAIMDGRPISNYVRMLIKKAIYSTEKAEK